MSVKLNQLSERQKFRVAHGYTKRIANIMKRDGITSIEEYRERRNERKRKIKHEMEKKRSISRANRSSKTKSFKKGKK